MLIVQISLHIVTFRILSLISQNLSLMQTYKEVNLHPRIAPYVNMWSVTLFLFLFFVCHLLNVGACVRHIAWESQVEWTTLAYVMGKRIQIVPHIWFVSFHSVICYTNSIVSCIHVNTTKLRNITCTLDSILRSWECGNERGLPPVIYLTTVVNDEAHHVGTLCCIQVGQESTKSANCGEPGIVLVGVWPGERNL